MVNGVERSRELQLEARDLEVGRLNAQLEECKAAAEDESKLRASLQTELEGTRGERDKALRRIRGLESKINLMSQEKANAKASMQRKVQVARQQIKDCQLAMVNEVERSREVQLEADRANAQLEECRAAAEAESKLRATLRSELEGTSGERDEALRRVSDLESKIDLLSQEHLHLIALQKQERADAETAMQEKVQEARQQIEECNLAMASGVERSRELQLEVERLNVQVVGCKAVAEDESKLRATLQTELEGISGERDEALRRISDLQSKIDLLSREKADAEIAMQTKVQEAQQQIKDCKLAMVNGVEGSRELQLEVDRLNARVEECKAAAEDESKLMGTLRSELERTSSERDEALRSVSDLASKIDVLSREKADAEIAMQGKIQEARQQTEDCKLAMANGVERSKELQLEVEQLNVQVEECKSVAEDESESRGKLQSDLEGTSSERDEALRLISDLESKIDVLSQEKADTESAMQGKVQEARQQTEDCKLAMANGAERSRELQLEVDRLNAQVEECKAAAEDESKLRVTLQSELEGTNSERDGALQRISDLECKIDQLSQEKVDVETVMQGKVQEARQQTEDCKLAMVTGVEGRRELQLEVDRLKAQVEECKATTDDESKLRVTLQSQLEGMNSERDEALRRISDLESKIDLLSRDKANEETAMQGKVPEANRQMEEDKTALQLEVDRRNVSAEKRKAAANNEPESRRTLQSDLERAAGERDEASRRVSDLEREIDLLREGLANVEKCAMTLKNEMEQSGKSQPEVERARARKEELKAQMEVLSELNGTLRSDLAGMTRKREEALRRIAALESEIDLLTREMTSAGFDGGTDNIVLNGTGETSNASDPGTPKGRQPAELRSGYSNEDVHRSNGGDTLRYDSIGATRASVTVGQTQMTTYGASSDGSPHHRTNRRRGSIFSRFGFRRSAEGSDAKSQATSEGTAHEFDKAKNEPEAFISPDAEVAQQLDDHIKFLMREIRLPEEENTVDNISLLRNAFTSLTDEKDQQSAEVATLRGTTEDLESTLSLQARQNEILKDELTRLRGMINDMETDKSSLEDSVEELKAKILKLELMSQLRKEEKGSAEEAWKTDTERPKLRLFRGRPKRGVRIRRATIPIRAE